MSTEYRPALIIVDLQEDFLPENGSLAVKQGRDIIPLILKLLDLEKYHWKAIVSTLDWHPANHTSFASNHNAHPYTTKTFEHPLLGAKETKDQVLWPDHCIQNTKGASFPAEFETVFTQLMESQATPTCIVKKGYLQDREYYSCFQDTWGVHHTECEEFLRKNNITHVFTVGLAYDYCVLNSSIDAARRGFTTYVVKQCSRAVYPDNDKATDEEYLSNQVQIVSFDGPELAAVAQNNS